MKTSTGTPRAFVHSEKLVAVGAGLAVVALVLLWRAIFRDETIQGVVLQLVWHRVEWVGLVSLFLLPLWLVATDRLENHKGLTYLPMDCAWWKYVVLGFAVTPWVLVFFLLLGGAVILLPVVAPAKVIYSYTLGPSANLASAVLAVPFVLLSVSLAFTVAYVTICAQGKGTLSFRDRRLVQIRPFASDVASLREVFFLSAATMLKGGADGFELTGWCRWLALFEVLVGKLLEIIIVGIGLGLILTRLTSS